MGHICLYTLGQGFKVAIKEILTAADEGLLERYSDVLGVGGTGRKADTAIAAGGTRTEDDSGQDSSK